MGQAPLRLDVQLFITEASAIKITAINNDFFIVFISL